MKPTQLQQSQYDTFLVQARSMIYDENTLPEMLKKLSSGDPKRAIAHTAAMIAASVKGGYEQQNTPVPPEVVSGGIKALVNDLLEIAVASKLMSEQDAKLSAKEILMDAMKLSEQPTSAQPQPEQPQPSQQGMVQQAMGA